MKRCFKCGELKPIDDFYKHPNTVDGHLGKCKECTRKDTSSNYRANKKHYHDYNERRYRDPEVRERYKGYVMKHRAENPEKHRARQTAYRATRDGRLAKGLCEACGDEKVEAHHDDYSKPLEVRWLCFKHHREVHNQEVFAEV